MNEESVFLTVAIRSFWHAGSGKGSASYLDAISQSDADGLPFLPGRTLRGLLLNAVSLAEQWRQLPKGSTFSLFGGWDPDDPAANPPTRHNVKSGHLIVGNATLSDSLKNWLKTQDTQAEDYRQALFQPLFSTAVNHESGCAKNKSLRGMQAAIPLTLTATITCLDPTPDWRNILAKALPLVLAVGSHRSRGFGRAVLTLGGG